MRNLNRREFLGSSALGLFVAGAAAGCAEGQGPAPAAAPEASAGTAPFNKPISFQSYGMRREIGEDFPGTLRAVKELGYEYVEMCSPRGNHYQEVGFGNLTALPPAEIKQQIEDAGLLCKSAHFQSHEVLVDDPAASADYAAALGLTDMVMSGSDLSDDAPVDAFKQWADKCNKVAEIVKASGVRLGYHNHMVGPMMEGKRQFDYIMEFLDPDLIGMQFQFASISDGTDIEYYLDKYAGRYVSLHLHDWDPKMKSRVPGRLGGVVPVGEGMIDWPATFRAAMKSPIEDHGYVVEIETEEPLEGLRRSIAYFKTLQV